MRRCLAPLAATVLALLLTGCATPVAPLVKDRYARLEGAPLPVPRILVSATARPAPAAPEGVGLLDLAPVAQAELVKATMGKPPLRLKPPMDEGRVRTTDRYERRIVIAVRPEQFLPPGTRLMAARIGLRPAGGRAWRFVDWDRLEKEREVVDVGRITTEDKSTVGGELNLAIGGPIGTPKLNFEQSRQTNQEMLVRDDFIQSAAIDGDGRAWIDQRVGGGRDLATNTVLDASFVADGGDLAEKVVFVLPPLWADGKPMPAAAVRIGSQTLLFPNPADARPLCGVVELTGWLRTIARGDRSYTEADDVVQIREVRDAAPFLLAPAPVEPLFGLATGGFTLAIAQDGGAPATLYLASLEEAIDLHEWLRAVGRAGGKPAGARLLLVNGPDERPLDAATIAGLVPTMLNAQQVNDARKAASVAQPCAAPPAN